MELSNWEIGSFGHFGLEHPWPRAAILGEGEIGAFTKKSASL